MSKSESIKNLAISLSKFQGEITNPSNTATNPFFKSKYAPLETVLNTVRPILSKHGLSVVQAPSTDGGNITISTTLIHESGEYMEFPELSLKMDKVTAQGAGSAITYARRYAISAILGISSEDDDDGNHAEEKSRPKMTANANRAHIKKDTVDKDKQALKNSSYASESQLKFISSLMKQKEYTAESMRSYIKQHYNKESSKDLTNKEASQLIKTLQEIGK